MDTVPTPESAGSGRAEGMSRALPGKLLGCSAERGWTSILLRRYREPLTVEDLELEPSRNAVIVLVRRGTCKIESLSAGRWNHATFRAGDLGMTPPGEHDRLRWYGEKPHETLHLHLPQEMLNGAIASAGNRHGENLSFPSRLRMKDTTVETAMIALESALADGADELYAASAGHWLASHILFRHGATPLSPARSDEGAATLRHADAYMRAHLAERVTLEDLARVAGCGTFQLIRIAKRNWGETPLQRMTRLRMEHACILLAGSQMSVISIALECGYSNPTHFGVAFRRRYGVTPLGYRHERTA